MVPCKQEVQDVAPVSVLTVPFGHGTHSVWSVGWYVPAEQSTEIIKQCTEIIKQSIYMSRKL